MPATGLNDGITDAQHNTTRLKAEALQRAIFNSVNFSSIATDEKGVIQIFNVGAERMLGYVASDVRNKITPADISDPQEVIARAQALSTELDTRIAPGFEALVFKAARGIEDIYALTYIRKDGSRFPAMVSVTALRDDDESIIGYLLIGTDNTARRMAEEKLRLAASVFTHAREGILITSVEGVILDVNEAFSRITGFERDDVLGKNPRILSSDRHGEDFYASLWSQLTGQGHWYGELWNRRKNGQVYAVMQAISAVRDGQGKTLQYVSLFSDITLLKDHEKELELLAHFDPLTRLPNRVLLADRLQQAITQSQRRGSKVAVVFLDLDGFKAVNDGHGHAAGDQLLMALAVRIRHALREGDTLARIGGDEFVAVLVDLGDVSDSVPMLTRMLAAAAEPVQLGSTSFQVSASLGVTFYPQSYEVDADLLLRQSDQAMYQAKLGGKNRYHIFDAEHDRTVRGHHESLESIRCALTEREFVLYYQPKVNMRTGKVIGAEALIRWQHPVQGLLASAKFLPMIENHQLAIDIGEWVIDTALTQMTLWRAAGLDLPVSVNVGAHQLQQPDFVERLRLILAAHPQLDASGLELEVLETSALEDVAGASQVIDACRAMGVVFALDDFGTGYSSLTCLKRLPVNLLKIDQRFVRDMLDDPDDLAILEGVISLASAFRRNVMAEGVETVAHGAMLLQLGCELAQGYGIARPMPAAELPAWARSWRTDPAWTNLPTVGREDLPLLFASADHMAWVATIEAFLQGARTTSPSLSQHPCRLGVWLAQLGRSRYSATHVFQAIHQAHEQLHALAESLLDLHARGQSAQALPRLPELRAVRDDFLKQLSVMMQVYLHEKQR